MSEGAKRPAYELADVVRFFGEELGKSGALHAFQKKVLTDVARCRTAALGGHVDACDRCGTLSVSYNSCRNRHCPKCQSVQSEVWVLSREQDLLNVPYFHVVFTVPQQINGWAIHNPRFVYDALFDAAWQTLRRFAADARWLGARTGATMVLHTWGQNLSLHPHVHAIVPGGGLGYNGQWTPAKSSPGQKFLFPVKAMSKVFKALFLRTLCSALRQGLLRLPDDFEPARYVAWRNELYGKKWVVYAKRPFGGPQAVLEYLGRYTHKSAISNHRLRQVSSQGVRFSYKDYRQGGAAQEMTLDGVEFLRRWCLHILPPGYRRMRHYGILSNAAKAQALAACRQALGMPQIVPSSRKELRALALAKLRLRYQWDKCPCCKEGRRIRIGLVPAQCRAPPPGELPKWLPLEH